MRGEGFRFWAPVFLLGGFACYVGVTLVRAHVDPDVAAPKYSFNRQLAARRGSIYSSYGKNYPFAISVPYWEYRLDPVDLTNGVVRRKGEPPRPKAAIVKTIAQALGLDEAKVRAMAENTKNRFQMLALSSAPEVHRTLADSTLVRGVVIQDHQVRQYLHGRSLAHVLGSINAELVGSAGLELRYNKELTGLPGTIRGMKDARGRELYDRRTISIQPTDGSDLYLTIEPNIQYETETALRWGLREYDGAESGWALVMDAATGAIYAMASFPDFDPVNYGHTTPSQQMNRTIAFNYEPGSVMKVLTAATAINEFPGRYGPNTVFRTNRNDERYYKLPGDGTHVWEPTMTLTEAIVHSSNIVIGKLAYDLGPRCLYNSFKRFGLGAQTGVELPGEQFGILPNPNKRMWDKASWSRAGIGQFVAVTAIQLANAYQAIANDGLRMKPYLVSKIVSSDGRETYRREPTPVGRVISTSAAQTVRKMMLGVAAPGGTAKRAAIRGYSVAGKTGTAQKQIPGGRGYLPGQYRASFCGIVPAEAPRLVIMVTLDFTRKNWPYHQGGMSAAPVFKRIALASIRYLGIPPDRPDEMEGEADEYDKILDERRQGGAVQL